MLAQYSSPDSGAGAVIFIYLLLLFGLAFIPAAIASNKGHSGVAYYFFGLFLFIPALIVALLLPSKTEPAAAPVMPTAPTTAGGQPPGMDQAAKATGLAGGHAPAPGSGVVRECPYCKEAMRRDASVCPHCRRESPAWEYRDFRWWTRTSDGQQVWYEERSRQWRDESYVPAAPETVQVLLISLGDAKTTQRVIFEKGNFDFSVSALRRLKPKTVISALPKDRAVALQRSLAEAGTVVELVSKPVAHGS